MGSSFLYASEAAVSIVLIAIRLLPRLSQPPHLIQPAGPLFLCHPLDGADEACLDRSDTGETQNVALQALETVGEKDLNDRPS